VIAVLHNANGKRQIERRTAESPTTFAICNLPFAIKLSLCLQWDACDFSKLCLHQNHPSAGAVRWSFFTLFR
jgi:hypothetical protein